MYSSSPCKVNFIACVNANLALGYDNRLLYRIPADLQRFKDMTIGNTVIMGRKTFKSIGNCQLPGRQNIVVSRFIGDGPLGVDLFGASNPTLAVNMATKPEVFCIGGESLFRYYFYHNYASQRPGNNIYQLDKLYLTYVDEYMEGDTHLPFDPQFDSRLVQVDVEEPEGNHNYEYRTYSFCEDFIDQLA